jgi:hypothetical protein
VFSSENEQMCKVFGNGVVVCLWVLLADAGSAECEDFTPTLKILKYIY